MPTHFFDTEVATEFGLVEAVLINHFQFWLAHNRANKSNQRQGRTWTYNSVKALQELFPYMGVKQIRGALSRLEEGGILLVDNYNQTPYDRTLWYAFADEDRWLGLPKSRIGKKAIDICQKGEPIPDKSPDKLPTENGDPSPTPPPAEIPIQEPDPPPEVVLRATEHDGVFCPWETETFWEAWEKWRRYKFEVHKFRYKSKLSEQAALDKLRDLSNDSEATAHAIFRQSMSAQWEGLYALKNENNGSHQTGRYPAGPAGAVKPGTSQARTDAIAAWGSAPPGRSPQDQTP